LSEERDPQGRIPGPPYSSTLHREETEMAKLWAILLILVTFLFVAPVIESGTSESSVLFQAIGTAEGGGGAG
jgi:hypothetical protein